MPTEYARIVAPKARDNDAEPKLSYGHVGQRKVTANPTLSSSCLDVRTSLVSSKRTAIEARA